MLRLQVLAVGTSRNDIICFDRRDGTLNTIVVTQGHSAAVSGLALDPASPSFATAGDDCRLVLYDVRAPKPAAAAAKAHARAATSVAFTREPNCVATGGSDGVVKLWDLTMGRLVHEFTQHTAPISALAIHPTEFLMASASQDRTLRLWDLESFEQVCCTPPESGQVRRVLFSEDGSALLSGAEESLKVWGWEPVRCFEQAEVRWSRLADMCIGPQQQLLAGSMRESMVSVAVAPRLSDRDVYVSASAQPGPWGNDARVFYVHQIQLR